MSRTIEETVLAGREAAARRGWAEAFDLLSAADREGRLSPEDLELLGEAAWWTGRLGACIDARERAYAGHLDARNSRRAAMLALQLGYNHFSKNASAVGTAWLNRAHRLLEAQPESAEHGYLERLRAVVAFEGARDHPTALEHARKALDLATRFGDRDLMALALHDQGRILVAMGRVEEGMALIDEATVAAVGGELGPWPTAAIYCNTITSCRDLADYRRAGQWSEAARRWCERQAISGFPGMCRVYRAEILRLAGAWAEAESEARRACEELQEFNLGYAAAAFSELGEIRLRVGDLAGAEEAFAQAHALGRDPQPGRALLLLAQGKAEAAGAALDLALGEEGSDRLHRARLLPARVEVALAAGDLEAAEVAAGELQGIASEFGSPALEAAALQARGAVSLAGGRAQEAVPLLRRACHLWQEVDAPYEAARARTVLGLALRAVGEQESASLELRVARSAFERLGAAPDARRVDRELEGDLGAAPRRERRTFLFTDVVRSTDLVEAIGDDAWADLVRWHDHTLRSLFRRHGGEEVDHAGDGFFVAFRDAGSVLRCAVDIQRTLAQHRRAHGFSPSVRIGLHAAEAARSGEGFRGRGVHQAARIAALAESGEILASVETLESAGEDVTASEPREVILKGFAGPVRVASVPWR